MSSSTAERALAMVMADPRGARNLGAELLAQAQTDHDTAGVAVALRVLGLAARELQETADAARLLRRSIATALQNGHQRPAAEARMSLALVLGDLGRQRAAIREIDRAVTDLDGLALARARMQRGILLRRVGRETEALEVYGTALASFKRHGDLLWQARALTNRGVLQAYRGGLAQARGDLARAEELYRELGLTAAVAQVQHNQGFVAAQGGDIVSALDWYDRADTHFQLSGGRPAVALIDRAELLLAARLLPEAAAAARDAVAAASAARLGSLLPQARLLQAQAALAGGDRELARTCARLARRAFERQQRDRWTVHARYLELRSSTHDNRARIGRIAEDLDAAGWPEQALEARLYAASAGDPAALHGLTSVRPQHGPARLRIHAWHAHALSRLHHGDPAGAKRALRSGLRLLDQYRAALGATELRVHSSAEGAELARLGVRMALRDGHPRRLLGWVERWRAAALRLRPTPPQDDELIRDLAQLRRAGSELASEDVDPVRRQRLLRQQKALEEAIRGRTWRAVGASTVDTAVPVSRIVATLGERALLELIEQDGQLIGIVVADGRVHLRPLAAAADVATEVAALRFAMRRLVLRHGSPASLAAADAAARHGLGQLGQWLIAPVRRLIGERDLVIVPTGDLQALPWSALPGCTEQPVTVAPSATAWWHAATTAATSSSRTVLVGANDPEHAVPEVQALADRWQDSTLLTGADATVSSTLSAMEGAGTAHVAAHGAFRADNPLFSHLSMSDGPLIVHDLAALKRAPDLIVLSACDTGLSSVHAGDELMGLTATMLSAGTRTLVASIGPVSDDHTRTLMLEMHRHLRIGRSPASALSAARRAADPGWWATAHSFACFGAGIA